jgi:hypothetical protein
MSTVQRGRQFGIALVQLRGPALAAVLLGLLPALPSTARASECLGRIPGAPVGTVYYVSPTGNDANGGTSPCAPWQSMTKVDSAGLRPGDTVAFEGGQTFTAPLSPHSNESGTRSRPLTVTSYGSGQALLAGGVFLRSIGYLTLTDLSVTNPSGPGIYSSASGTGVAGIVIEGSAITNTSSYGIASNLAADAGWTVQGDVITSTGDSGIYSRGGALTVTANTITDAGTNAAIGWPKHGVYAKGPGAVVIGNTIAGSQTSGVSLRYQNDVVQDNTITGGQKGIDFSSESATGGTTYVLGNTVSGTADTGFSMSAGTQPLHEAFVVASNTIDAAANDGAYLSSGSPSLTLADNLFEQSPSGSYLSMPSPATYTNRTYSEHNDLWYGNSSSTPFLVNGTARTFSAYASWFGAGAVGNDLTSTAPLLDPTTFALGANSPALGAGTASVPSVTYARVASCPASGSTTPLVWQYCGTAPDIGSH